MGRFDSLTQLEQKTEKATPLLRQEDAKVTEHQFASKLANQQTSKETNQQTSKETNQQTSTVASQQSTKEKKKYGTYLREGSISAIQMLGVQTKRKDHVVLQEIVDFYFANKK